MSYIHMPGSFTVSPRESGRRRSDSDRRGAFDGRFRDGFHGFRVRSCGIALVLLLVPLTACGASIASEQSSDWKPVLECGFGQVSNTLPASPGRLGKITELYRNVHELRDLHAVKALIRSKNADDMTPVEWSDFVRLVTAMDSCAKGSLQGETRGLVSALVPSTAVYDPNTLGPALCPGIDASRSSIDYRFQPRCDVTPAAAAGGDTGSAPAVTVPAGGGNTTSGGNATGGGNKAASTAVSAVTTGGTANGSTVAAGSNMGGGNTANATGGGNTGATTVLSTPAASSTSTTGHDQAGNTKNQGPEWWSPGWWGPRWRDPEW